MKSNTTTIYLLVSVCIILLGLVLLFAFKQHVSMLSISTSIIAGGISSMAFGINRYLEERASERTASAMGQTLEGLSHDLDHLDHALQDVRTLTMIAKDPNERRIFDRHPEAEFREELKQIRKGKHLTVDATGMSLRQFCSDYLEELMERGNITMRLLIQHPLDPSFALLCHQEGREEKMKAEEVLLVTERVLKVGGNHNETCGGSSTVEIKWLALIPSVTLTRINNVIFVRARYLKEANHPPMVIERYYEIEGRCFSAFVNYFQVAWEDGVIPTPDLCDQVRQRIASL